VLPEDWKARILEAAQERDGHDDVEARRRQLEGRLSRLRELYSWGDLERDEYQAQRDALERELTRLQPLERSDDRLAALAAYVESLPAAWADATQAQRSQLANILYEEVHVDGPIVEYVKPRPELEPLFQVRAGAAQPLECCLSHSNVGSGDPDGHRKLRTGLHLGRWHGMSGYKSY